MMKHMNSVAMVKSASSPSLAAPSSVFLVDDDASVRRALARLIKSAGHSVQTFASAREFLDTQAGGDGAACLVLDVRMPGVTGIDLQRELQTLNRDVPIVFITGHGDIPMSVKAMKAGAVDFLQKPVKDKDLLKAIEQSLAQAARDQSRRAEIDQIQKRVESLTPRELEVMALVVTGMLNKQIAFKLGTVEKTIKVHRARVMAKMGVDSIAELVRLTEKINIHPAQNQ
ncbi:MAG TPA: response regulator [Candidatus Binatia bacterium]